MAYLSNEFNFTGATGQVLSGTSDVVSSNVYSAGSAKKKFAGTSGRIKIAIAVTGPAVNADNTIRARFVAADNAALTTNPDILADTGVSASGMSTTAAAGVTLRVFELSLADQPTARQFYGLMFTQGGTTPAFTVQANLVECAQSNLP